MRDVENGLREHTPGPWRWEFVGTAGQWMLLGVGDAFVKVGGPPDIELSLDQVLIAMAPELLDFIEALPDFLAQAHFPNCRVWHGGTAPCSCRKRELINGITDIVAKARGT